MELKAKTISYRQKDFSVPLESESDKKYRFGTQSYQQKDFGEPLERKVEVLRNTNLKQSKNHQLPPKRFLGAPRK